VTGYSWQGASGRWYDFDVARTKRAWDEVGGVYMFVKPSDCPTGEWGGPICLFIGAADDFSISLERHNAWAAADQLGAKEVHVLPIPDDALRAHVEKDLLEAQRPILNRNLRRVA
jgi:hypothetical protein